MIGMATTALGLGLALYVSLQAYNQGMVLFSWHPVLMSVSALFLSTAGIQALHSALSNLGVMSMLGGMYAIYTNKENMGKEHWTSWHSWAGLLAAALWVANVAVAAANTVDLDGKRLVFLWKSRNHRWLGKAAFCAGLWAVVLGLHSGWGMRSLGGEQGVWVLTAGVVGLFVGVVAARGEGHPPKKSA